MCGISEELLYIYKKEENVKRDNYGEFLGIPVVRIPAAAAAKSLPGLNSIPGWGRSRRPCDVTKRKKIFFFFLQSSIVYETETPFKTVLLESR